MRSVDLEGLASRFVGFGIGKDWLVAWLVFVSSFLGFLKFSFR